MNLTNDPEALVEAMNTAHHTWHRILERVSLLVSRWRKVIENQLDEHVKVRMPDFGDSPLHGSILDKHFRIHLTPLQKDGALYAEMVLTVVAPHDAIEQETLKFAYDEFEVGRMLMDSDGNILTPALEQILQGRDSRLAFTLFMNILDQVLQANTPKVGK